MTFDNLLSYILPISMRMQNFIKIFQTVLRVTDIFTNRPESKLSQTGRWQNQMFDYRAVLEIQLSVDFFRVVQ